jgi:hypothetical protein
VTSRQQQCSGPCALCGLLYVVRDKIASYVCLAGLHILLQPASGMTLLTFPHYLTSPLPISAPPHTLPLRPCPLCYAMLFQTSLWALWTSTGTRVRWM